MDLMREYQFPARHFNSSRILGIGVTKPAILRGVLDRVAFGTLVVARQVLIIGRHALRHLMACLAFNPPVAEMGIVAENQVRTGFFVSREKNGQYYIKYDRNHRIRPPPNPVVRNLELKL
jgi:hypothetical protein